MAEVYQFSVPNVSPARSKRFAEGIDFTVKFIKSCPIPKSLNARQYYYDNKQRGLILMVTGRGIKSFQVRGRFQGRSQRVTLGHFTDMTIEQARIKALETIASFAKGENPNAEKQAVRKEETFGGFFKRFMEAYSKRQKRTWKADEWQVNQYLKDWFSYKLSAITRQDVVARHLKVTNQNGPYAANRLLSCIKTLFSKAIEWGWRGKNPASDVRKNREKSRDRFLQPSELPRFMKALDEEPNQIVADYFRVSLQTGARKSNVLAMRWDEIDFKSRVWRIPEAKSKNGEAMTVVLSSRVIEALERRREGNIEQFGTSGEWVFPGAIAKDHFKEPKMAWKRVLKAAGIQDLRIHDLRRTFGSYLAAQGATTAIIGKTLGHKSTEATKVYERLNIDPVRVFVNKTECLFREGTNE